MSKTKALAILLIIISAALFAGYILFPKQEQQEYATPMNTLTIGSPPQAASTLVYLAKEKRYFEEIGLSVPIKEYHFGFAAIEALVNKNIDIAFATDFAFVSSYFDNKELRILCSVGRADVEELIARRDSGISTIEDLIGKKIGIKKNSSAEFHLSTFLLFNKIPLDAIQIIDLPPPELAKAVLTKQIDATVIWPPIAFHLNNELGGNAMKWSAQSGQPFFWLAITTERILQEKPTVVKNFLASLLKAENFFKENSAQARQIVQNFLNFDAAYLDYYWPKQMFTVELSQSLLIKMEDETRWKIMGYNSDEKGVPNYLNVIAMDMLKQLRPQSITIIQ